MKNNKLFIRILSGFLLMTSCDTDDNLTTNIQETVGSGAVLRTISVEGEELDVLDLDTSITIMFEEQDEEDGDLLESVDVFLSLIDNTTEDPPEPEETLFSTIPASEFTDGPFNFPRNEFSGTLGEFTSALGLSEGQFNCGDAIVIRLSLNLTDGRTFSADSTTGNVSGGAFFSSPFSYQIDITANLPSDELFTGMYQLTQTMPGVLGDNDYTDGIYNIIAVNGTTRLIQGVSTLSAFGGFGPVNVEFQFICGEIVLSADQSILLAEDDDRDIEDLILPEDCSGDILSGPATMNSLYNLEAPDDTSFIINFTSDTGDSCGGGAIQAQLQLIQQ